VVDPVADDEGDETSDIRERSLTRVLALSDGVFAIAMTLLVLTLNLPNDTNSRNVGHALRETRPQLQAYAISFAVIAILWLAHHRMWRVVAVADFHLLTSNLVYLSLIALIPFPTEVLGDYGSSSAAVVFYAAALGLTGITGSFISLHVLRAGLAQPQVPRHVLVHGVWRGLSFAGVFLVSIPIALVSAKAAELTWLLVAVIHLVLQRHFGTDRPGHKHHQ
jgi:uncharacterized membrane protein